MYAGWLAEEIGAPESVVSMISRAAMLRDIGKIAVPTHILRKPGGLTAEERDVMAQHPVIGAMIVQAMPNMKEIVDGVLYHHEQYDGGGYPEGLKGDDIPVLGRLLAIADAFSARSTTRPYRKALTWPEAAGAGRTIGQHSLMKGGADAQVDNSLPPAVHLRPVGGQQVNRDQRF